jgi:class 3 adenylate cyclase
MSLVAHSLIASASVRQSVARLIATYFLLHLHEEMRKPDAVIYEDYPDLPIREITKTWVERIRHEFAIGEDEKLPEENLFERWTNINGKFNYEDSGLFGYNQIYLFRLLDLRDGTPESRETLFNTMRKRFDSFDYEKQGFTVSFFLNSESTMRELLREAVHKYLPECQETGDHLVLAQSGAIQTAMYEYFEGILKTALAENVRLLNGILPEQVALELKRNGFVEPVLFKDAAVIFTDFEGFSHSTEHLAPAEVIRRLDTYFTEFDRIIAAHGLEKIKTIGDSYMAVAGVPELHDDPVTAACDAAIEICETSHRLSAQAGPDGWNIRIGIHAGPLVAGVIGKQKFSYDVWGATVNFASRMESSGEPGRINVSAEVHSRVETYYRWQARGPQPVKHLGTAEMYFLLGKKTFL